MAQDVVTADDLTTNFGWLMRWLDALSLSTHIGVTQAQCVAHMGATHANGLQR